jgi:hypothetical protein
LPSSQALGWSGQRPLVGELSMVSVEAKLSIRRQVQAQRRSVIDFVMALRRLPIRDCQFCADPSREVLGVDNGSVVK